MRVIGYSFSLIALFLVACTDRSPLTLDDRAKFTAELIAERPECKQYWMMLSAKVANEAIIDQTYRSAKSAHCLKPNV